MRGLEPGFASRHGGPSPSDGNHCSSIFFPSVCVDHMFCRLIMGILPQKASVAKQVWEPWVPLSPFLQSCPQPGICMLECVGHLWGGGRSSKQGVLDFLNSFDLFNLFSLLLGHFIGLILLIMPFGKNFTVF